MRKKQMYVREGGYPLINKGFTLIELLAVIVILAIIALIAVPIVLNIIGDTRVSAAKRSAENYIDAVELYLVRSEMDINRVTLDRNNKYNVTSSTTIEEKTYPKINELVEISGSKPTGNENYVQLNQKGKVIEAELTMNGYKIVIKNGKIVSATKGDSIPLQSIKLNYIEQTMEKGSNFKIIPTFNPENASNQEVTYVSSDESIVTVDEQGNVTAKEVGTAKITVTSKENENIKAECNVTVIINATGLKITSNETEVDAGKTIQLTGIIEPSNATTNSLSWKSSNADIASVDTNGKVTGISEGIVTITAITVNGIEATKEITVYPYVEAPDLYNNSLTPVIYIDNAWKVADTTSRWYNYSKQEWANAVVLKSGVTKNIGDTVNIESEVQGMFVWIPRYEYKIEGQYGTHLDGTIGTSELPGEIKVKFVSKSTTTATSGYIMHPAFTFGNTQQGGIWVGKFETTGTEAIPTILPNLSSSLPINDNALIQFRTAKNFGNYLNLTADSHMMKNSEWGAVAYLSQSKYGKYGNSMYTGINKEVYENRSSTFITGSSNGNSSGEEIETQCIYDDVTDRGNGVGACGAGASTTGNITGVYDMSGGAYERVMGIYNKNLIHSGFTESNWPEEKYYDNYTSENMETACNNGICYGHALSETEGWYADGISFVNSDGPWLYRGRSNSKIGIFSTWHTYGLAGNYISFRITLCKS